MRGEAVGERGSVLDVHREHHEMLPVWVFVGVLLLFYGTVILVVGIRDYSHPPPVVLAKFHADLWAGIILIGLGAGFTLQSVRSRMAKRGKKLEIEERATAIPEHALDGRE
jgi:hypothetical protein